MQPSDGRRGPVGFAQLMQLDEVGEGTYRSVMESFEPGKIMRDKGMKEAALPRTYGGHVYAQAVWAAAHTVPHGFAVHSVTGYFTSLGLANRPFIYSVKEIRSGKSYAVRSVQVTQRETSDVCFTCTASFKRPSPGPIEFADKIDLDDYSSVLRGKKHDDHPDYISTEVPPLLDLLKREPSLRKSMVPFPGLITKKVDMTAFNKPRAPRDRRQLHFYKGIGPFPSMASAPNLHACAHLYASDRNSLFVVSQHLDLERQFEAITSLSYTVVFHSTSEPLAMVGEQGEMKWFTQEAWTDRYGDDRGLHRSRIFNAEGLHIATTMQDGMLRPKSSSEDEMERAQKETESGSAHRAKL